VRVAQLKRFGASLGKRASWQKIWRRKRSGCGGADLVNFPAPWRFNAYGDSP
jgi:hypothetical protein